MRRDVDLEALDREGWVAVPVLRREVAGDLAARCSAVLDQLDLLAGDKRGGGTRRMAGVLERVPEAAPIFEHSDLLLAVAHLIGPDVPLGDVAFRCPQPGFGEQTFHADDLPLERSTDSRAVTAIVALGDFGPVNGSTAVVPGSHRRPDLQRQAARLPTSTEVVLTGPAGTAFVFSAHLVHRGTRNRSSHPRPALQATWRRSPPGAPGA